jgi:hypothetical protein
LSSVTTGKVHLKAVGRLVVVDLFAAALECQENQILKIMPEVFRKAEACRRG